VVDWWTGVALRSGSDLHFRFTELAVDVYGPGFGDRGYLRLEQYIFWISCQWPVSLTPAEGPGQGSPVLPWLLMPTINQNPPWENPRGWRKSVKTFCGRINFLMDRFCRRTVPVLCGLEVTGSVFGYNNSRHVDVGFRYLMASARDMSGRNCTTIGACHQLSIGIKFPTPFFRLVFCGKPHGCLKNCKSYFRGNIDVYRTKMYVKCLKSLL
jgi:hypothetical protein